MDNLFFQWGFGDKEKKVKGCLRWRPCNRYEQEEYGWNKMVYQESMERWRNLQAALQHKFKEITGDYPYNLTGGVAEE